ncbi:hypothetical protein AB0F03_36250 [Streptomyces sp. NPDC028722]|uniref:hypothetical protein n=1 Tax=Streptomyces sp. NPDC028722 TaxID=3155016 RepID=UPI0033F30852
MTPQQAETTYSGGTTPPEESFLLLTKIKPGQADALRDAIVAAAGKLADRNGALAQVGTVHSARFAIIGEDTFLFASHFDGSWESYLDDFYTFSQEAEGFDLIWRYCEDWPGPHDREGFLNFWKSHRVMDVLTYSHFPGVTCKQIEKALHVRDDVEAVLENFQ